MITDPIDTPEPVPPPLGVPTAEKDSLEWDAHQLRQAAAMEDWKARQIAREAREVAQQKLETDREVASTTRREDRLDKVREQEVALLAEVQTAYIEVMKGSLDRSLTRANVVITVAGTLATLYSGLLGFIFKVDGTKLPYWAVFPDVFFGTAIAGAAGYVAFIAPQTRRFALLPTGRGGRIAEQRLINFLNWVSRGITSRSWMLRVSIYALGAGVLFLPWAFTDLPGLVPTLAFVVTVGILILALVVEYSNDATGSQRNDDGTRRGGQPKPQPPLAPANPPTTLPLPPPPSVAPRRRTLLPLGRAKQR